MTLRWRYLYARRVGLPRLPALAWALGLAI